MIHIILSVEFFLFLGHSIPPTPTTNDLSDRWVIITFTYIKAEDARARLRLDVIVLAIQNLV